MKNIYAIVLTMLITSLIVLSPLTLSLKVTYALPGPRIYLQPSDITFYSNVTSVGQKFNVTVMVQNATSIGGAQIYLEFNDSIINVTRWFEPTTDPQYIFHGKTTSALPTPPDPGYVHVSSGKGYVQTSVSLFPVTQPGFTGDGKICIFEFKITAEPPEDGQLTCSLHINTDDTYLLDQASGDEVPNVTKEDGTYSFVYAPPLPAFPHIWLEASPNIYEAIRPRPFNVSIIIQNVSGTDGILGVQFEVHYNHIYLEATEITPGDFFSNPTWAPFGTFAVYDVEDGRALYGEMILPNDVGEWAPPFPSGNGTVAIITFMPLLHESVDFNITIDPLFDEFFIDKDGEFFPHLPSKPCEYTYNARLPKVIVSVYPSEYISSHLGENFDINITVTDLDEEWELVYMEFKLEYDPTFIDAIDVTEGDFMAQFGETTFNYTQGTGYVKANITLTPTTVFPSGDGTIATITFNVTSRPPAASNLLLKDTSLLDPDGYEVVHVLSHGYYTMHEVLVHEITVDTLTFYIITVSNASISPVPMVFDIDHRMLYFNVTGWGTPAFVEITIPNDLIDAELGKWLVLAGMYRIIPSVTAFNETHTLLAFTFNFTSEPVRIFGTGVIPEIPSSVMPLIFLLATLASLSLASVVFKKRRELKLFK